MAEVELSGIEKRFDGVRVLESLDLAVADGEFVVLLGPSGCGKTTALRIIAGLETPTAGRVLIGGRDVTALAPRERDVAMVFQSYALYPHMSIEDNIGYPLRIRGVPEKDRAAAVARVAGSLEVGHLLKRKPRQLSGGQRQRIALARALVRRPRLLILDDATSAVDPQVEARILAGLRTAVQGSEAATTVLVIAYRKATIALADEVLFLADGRIADHGTHPELQRRSAAYRDLVDAYEKDAARREEEAELEAELDADLDDLDSKGASA
jgi:ABC-type sugar transport system ATPase subunit